MFDFSTLLIIEIRNKRQFYFQSITAIVIGRYPAYNGYDIILYEANPIQIF